MRIRRRVSPPPRFLSRDVGDPARIGDGARTSSFTVFPFSLSRELRSDRAGCLARGAIAHQGRLRRRRVRNVMGDEIIGSEGGLALSALLGQCKERDETRPEAAIVTEQAKVP